MEIKIINDEFKNNFAKNLCAIKRSSGLSVEAIAEVLDKSPRSIAYALSTSNLPSMTDIYRISDVCKISIDSLLLKVINENDIESAAKNIKAAFLSLRQSNDFYDRGYAKEVLLLTLRKNLLLYDQSPKDTSFLTGVTTLEAYKKAYDRLLDFRSTNIVSAVNIFLIARSLNLSIDELCEKK